MPMPHTRCGTARGAIAQASFADVESRRRVFRNPTWRNGRDLLRVGGKEKAPNNAGAFGTPSLGETVLRDDRRGGDRLTSGPSSFAFSLLVFELQARLMPVHGAQASLV